MIRCLPLPVILAIATSAASAQVVYLNDTFADLDRTNQALPGSAQWTFGAHNATAANAFASLNAGSGALLWDHTGPVSPAGNTFSAIWSYFTASGSPVSLAVGETITLTFDVSFAVAGGFLTSAGAFRFALFNSNGVRTTTDFAGTSEPGIASGTTFSGWRGYEAQTPLSNVLTGAAGTNDFLTRERTGTGNGLFTSTNWTPNASSAVVEPLFASATTYQGFLSVSRTGAGAIIQAGINGALTNSFVDSTAAVISFDTIAFFELDGLTKDSTIDNVSVSVVPEPGTAWLLAGGLLGMIRRRRRS